MGGKRKDIINENLFTTIAKMLALPALKANMSRLDKKFKSDPDLQSTIKSIEFHTDELERKLKLHCKRWPDSPHCKDKQR